MPEPSVATPRVRVVGASKTFAGIRVLSDVTLDILPGEIHGLVGQNGSGKSTLIKLLSGYHAADSGFSFDVDGRELALPIRPRELQSSGVSFVHQDLGLVADASVVENVMVGRFTVGRFSRRVQWRDDAAKVSAVLDRLGVGGIDPFAIVSTLTYGERASVAIARAILGISEGSGLVVFDESTQSLPREILHEFYIQVRALAASGTAVLIVSHRLDEILAICDRVTVLEDGSVTVSGMPTSGLTEADLTRLILGRSPKQVASLLKSRNESPRGGVVISLDHVAGGRVADVSVDLHAGEIVGVIGNTDSGYDELPYLAAGAAHATSGTLGIDGIDMPMTRLTPKRAIDLGICLVPGKRSDEGIVLDVAAYENVSIPRVSRGLRRVLLRRRWQETEFDLGTSELSVVPANPDLATGSFSGGNQQKILLAKWFLNKPRVLVLHEPTQAVDVGARADIMRALRREAAHGLTVLISSLESDDLASVCDRVLIMRDGRVITELQGDDLTTGAIIDACYGQIDTSGLVADAVRNGIQ